VKNLMAVGKSLILTATFVSLIGCTSHSVNQSASVKNSVTGPYGAALTSADVTWRLYQDWHYRLDDSQKAKQTSSVYAALESDYGIVYKWFEGNAFGAAKAVHGYPQGSGFCKVIYTTVKVNNRQRTYEDTACKEAGHEGWRFVVK